MNQMAQWSKKDRELREKVASTMLRLDEENRGHMKRAHALRLLYKKAEMGVEPLPQTFSELEEKLATLAKEDLTVLERALELTGGSLKLGGLDRHPDPSAMDASEQFRAAILGDDL